MTIDPYPTLAELRAEHSILQADMRTEQEVQESGERIAEFVARTVATGTRLDARDDRRAAQAIINYWVSVASTAADATSKHPLSDAKAVTLLAEYDPATLKDAVAAADGVLADPATDHTLARAVVLRLVRLRPEGKAFDPVPVARAGLHDVGPAEAVDRLVVGLAAAGVLRVTPGESLAADQIALRATELMTDWHTLKRWMDERLTMRRRAADYASRPGPTRGSRAERAWAGVVQCLAGVSQWAGRQVGRHGLRLGSADGRLRGDELAEVQAYHDRNGDERLLLDDSRKWEQRNSDAHRTLLGVAALAVVLAVLLLVATLASARQTWLKSEEAKKAEKEAKKAEKEAKEASREVEANAISASTSNLAVTAMWVTEKPGVIHIAKKLLILQTLRQVLFAPTNTSAAAARANWNQLEKELCEQDRSPKEWDRKWFTSYLRKEHRKDIDDILKGSPNDREAVDKLRWLSHDLKQYFDIQEAKDAIATVSQSVVYDAGEVAKRIAAAAEGGRGIDECWPDRRAFWRLDCLGLVLAVPDGSPADRAAKAFADALRRWEDEGTMASPELVQELKRSAIALSDVLDTVVRPLDIDPLKLRMEQKQQGVPRK